MSVFIVTGKLGNGKTLVSVGRIRDAIRARCKIATNLDIDLKAMFHRQAKDINLMRIPDKPTIDDLNAIGKGYDGKEYDESKFGILVLDECGTWFNSRNWQDKSRKEVNDWFLHARKLGWHVYIIIQDISMLDSQARDAIGELLVTCKRLDKLRVPGIGGLIKLLTGWNPTMPRIHRAKVTYADGLVSDVWVYRGNDLFNAYDTRQSFIASYPHGTHSLLTPWHTSGRYAVEMNWRNKLRMTKIYWKRFSSPAMLAAGLFFGAFAMLLQQQSVLAIPAETFVQGEPVQTLATELPPVPVAPANPFDGAKIYLVGDVSGFLLFQVHFADKGFLSITQAELINLGFKVQRIGKTSAKVSFDGQVTYALPKPTIGSQIASTSATAVDQSVTQ